MRFIHIMTVRDNMGFALRFAGMPKDEIDRQVNEAAHTLALGQLLQQAAQATLRRAAPACCHWPRHCAQARVFLFDEPLSNLDAELRVHMRIELARLHKSLATTVIYVTHDQVEAMTLADKIVVMNHGVISQVGAPLDVYDNPDNLFVAGFIGSPKINFVKGLVERVSKTGVSVSLPGFQDAKVSFSTKTAQLSVGDNVTVGLRPQHFSDTGALKFKLNVELIEHLGGESFVYAGNGSGDLIAVATGSGRGTKAGDKFEAHIDPAKALLFDQAGQRVR